MTKGPVCGEQLALVVVDVLRSIAVASTAVPAGTSSAAATSTVPAAATTTASTVATAPAAAATVLAGLGLVDRQGATAEVLSVEGRDRLVPAVLHLDEAEAT